MEHITAGRVEIQAGRVVFVLEGATPVGVRFQVRPDPFADPGAGGCLDDELHFRGEGPGLAGVW